MLHSKKWLCLLAVCSPFAKAPPAASSIRAYANTHAELSPEQCFSLIEIEHSFLPVRHRCSGGLPLLSLTKGAPTTTRIRTHGQPIQQPPPSLNCVFPRTKKRYRSDIPATKHRHEQYEQKKNRQPFTLRWYTLSGVGSTSPHRYALKVRDKNNPKRGSPADDNVNVWNNPP